MLRCSGWGHLFGEILEGERAFRPRSAVRCTKIVSKFYDACGQNWALAKYMLSEQIRSRLYQEFWEHVQPLSDPIVCDLVTKGITQKADQTYAVPASCRKENAACHLPAFLASHQTRLRSLADYLTVHPHTLKDQARFERLLTAMIADPRAALGQTSCWPLGDLIIALQVPANALLWTLDADFAPLAEALGIALYHQRGPTNKTGDV